MQTPEMPPTEIEIKSFMQSTPAEEVDLGVRENGEDSSDQITEDLDEVIPPHTSTSLTVVGLGGSAGAISALRDFFTVMPSDSGMVFVVVIHLSPEYESSLSQLLQQHTAMRVTQVTDAVCIEPNCVYVIPPNAHLSMSGDQIYLLPLNQPHGKRVAVDLFFRALADTHGSSAIGIVLSGADGDGSIGIKRIKERGGLTIAQEPTQAEHESMPRSAITTGMVDWILPVEQMPQKLMQHQQNEKRMRLPSEARAHPDETERENRQQTLEKIEASDEVALREVLAVLRSRVGHDFSHYKRATVLRRIGRRLQVNNLPNIPTYLDFLRTNPGEAGALLHDLLISVTNFFRDPESFAALQEVLPQLFKGKKNSDQVRVWVAGCATGDEAYSVAIMLAEYSATLDSPPSILVFATDLSDEAIRVAREGSYPETIIADVSPERLRRFFIAESGRFRIKKDIRESVLFAVHDLLKDSPFSRLDLVTCRNLLIYLKRASQQRVFETFHFALRPEGILFLGTSESADDQNLLFAPQNKKHRLYTRRATSHRVLPPLPLPILPLSLPATTSPRLLRHSTFFNTSDIDDSSTSTMGEMSQLPGRKDAGGLHLRLLERYAPPSALINEDYDILHLSDNAGQFLQYSGGEISSNLLKIVHPALRLELSTALFAATQRREEVRVSGVPMENGVDGEEDPKSVNLQVRPVLDSSQSDQGLFLVLFEEAAGVQSVPRSSPEAEPIARKLHEETQYLKANLRATIDQYEASVEELRASNEELQAMNEESRSTAEELETGKEELQSVNEELITVNQELKGSVDELARANSDLQNLMTSTEIATVFLNRAFHIVRYTPRAAQIFNIIPSDVGRPISHITHRLDYPDLRQDVEQVLADLKTIEREVGTLDGRWFLARLLPYRTADDYIDGVVLTLVDITSRREHELKVQQLVGQIEQQSRIFHTTLTSISDFAYILDQDGRFVFANQPLLDLLGIKREEIVGKNFFDLHYPDDLASRLQKQIQHVLDTAATVRDETMFTNPAGSAGFYEYILTPVFDEDKKVQSVAGSTRDVTERKASERALRESEERYRMFIEGTEDYAIFMTDPKTNITSWNSGVERLLDYSDEEFIGQPAAIIFTPEDRAAGVPERETGTAAREGRAPDERWHLRKDGSRFFASGVMSVLRDENGEITGFAKILRDVTDRKRMEEELEARVQERTLELALSNDELRVESAQRLDLEQIRQQLLERLVTTQEDERRRISRELHDQMGQQLTALLLGLKSLPTVLDETAASKMQPRLETLQALTDGLMDQVHHLAWELRPAVLDNLGLEAAIKQYVEQWSLDSGLEVDFITRGFSQDKRLPLPVETVLYRVVQESLTNVQRHAEAGRVSILLERIDNEVVAIVEDDGQGFNIGERHGTAEPSNQDTEKGSSAMSAFGKSSRLGLLGMRERMELVGGTLTIESVPGEGTSVYARVPVIQNQNDDSEEAIA